MTDRNSDCAMQGDDAELFDWFTGRCTPAPAHDHDVMRLLRSFRDGNTGAVFTEFYYA
jgi:succinate dehydrogenase flavin-adding protein (antitoxin of CptAB toxin-antitoxin module)